MPSNNPVQAVGVVVLEFTGNCGECHRSRAGGAHPLPERHTLGEFLDRRDVRAREVHAIAVERDLNADRWRVWTEIELPREGAQRDRGAIVGRAGALDIPGRAE